MATATNLKSLTNDELVKELARVYVECLDRLDVHHTVGGGDEEGDAETESAPEALDLGVVFASKLDAISSDFMFGASNGGLLGWNWGIRTFHDKMRDASVGLAVAEVIDAA